MVQQKEGASPTIIAAHTYSNVWRANPQGLVGAPWRMTVQTLGRACRIKQNTAPRNASRFCGMLHCTSKPWTDIKGTPPVMPMRAGESEHPMLQQAPKSLVINVTALFVTNMPTNPRWTGSPRERKSQKQTCDSCVNIVAGLSVNRTSITQGSNQL